MTEQLPWDKYLPPAPEPELPYVPNRLPPAEQPYGPPDLEWDRQRPPAGPPDADVKDLAKDLLDEAMSYARQTIAATVAGREIDHARPTVTVETEAGKQLVIADAKSRSMRTLAQGLLFDIAAAIIAAVATLSGADLLNKTTWIAFAILVGKSVVAAGISFVMRLKVTPTIKTPGQRMNVMPLPQRIPEEVE